MLSVCIYLVGELSVSDGLRSVGGLQVASGWLMQTLLGLFVLASGWLASIFLALFVIASGWFPQILLAFFALCYSQWVAYVDFAGIFCYSQCVVCTDPLTLCVLSVGALRSSFCFLLVLFCFTCSASGGLRIFFVLIFPVLDRSVGQRLPCSEPHPKFVCFLGGGGVYCDLEESITEN